jgi:hypothetical protein
MTLEQAEALWRKTRRTPHGNGELLRQVKLAARQFKAKILVRDLAELLATVFVVCIFVYKAMLSSAPRLAYLTAACLAGLPIVFLGIHRWLKHESHRPSNTVREHVEQTLRAVQNQQWLLQHVLWWYLMPLAASVAIFLAATLITATGTLAGKLITVIVGMLVCAAVGVLVWRLSRLAVRTNLEPFAQHLRELAKTLRGE